MKKWEKEILQKQVDDEFLVINRLRKTYQFALDDIKDKIAVLQAKPQIQSVIYQLQYQKSLEAQLKDICDSLCNNWYKTTDQYLKECYEDAFYSTMYGLHQQNVPLIFPIPQKEIVQMASQSAYTGIKLSDKLYSNTNNLARIAREEISRGIATGQSYFNIARGLELRGESTLNQSLRIAKTEGHRINQEVSFKTLHKAKEKGADVVKQWDSTLDGNTRETHRELDGQLRELDQPFKILSNGHTTQYPGAFGIASEDINCRCVVLQRARWALDKSETDKMVGDLSNLSEDKIQKMADKLGVDKDDLKNAQGNLIKAKNYNNFKKKYQKKSTQVKAKQEAQNQIKSKQQLADDHDTIMKSALKFSSVKDADKYHRPKTEAVWNDLSKNEQEALWRYTSNDYRIINGHLRFGNNVEQKYKDYINQATSALEKCHLEDDVWVRRGLTGGVKDFASWFQLDLSKLSDSDYQKELVGWTVEDRGFVSTGIADGAGFSGFNLEICLPKGTQAIYAEPFSYYGATNSSGTWDGKQTSSYVGGEAEVIVQRNSTFEIKEIKTDSKGYITDVILMIVKQSH